MFNYKTTRHYISTEGFCIARLYEVNTENKVNFIVKLVKAEENYISHLVYCQDKSKFVLAYFKEDT